MYVTLEAEVLDLVLALMVKAGPTVAEETRAHGPFGEIQNLAWPGTCSGFDSAPLSSCSEVPEGSSFSLTHWVHLD